MESFAYDMIENLDYSLASEFLAMVGDYNARLCLDEINKEINAEEAGFLDLPF
jgi:hypothetical protein